MEPPKTDLSELFANVQFFQIFLAIIAFFVIIFVAKGVRKISQAVENKLPSYRLLSLQLSTIITFVIYIFGTAAIVMGVIKPSEKLILGLGGSAAVAHRFCP